MNKYTGTKEEQLEKSDKAIQANLKRIAKQIDESKERKQKEELINNSKQINTEFVKVNKLRKELEILKKENEMNPESEGKPEQAELGRNKNLGVDANAGQARDDSSTATRLLDKNWSPLIVRKYQMEGWPMFIGIICDANLNDLDDVVYNIWDEAHELGFVNGTIQGHRNCCGLLSDRLVAHYNKTKRGVMEGNCVFWYTDKLAISSAYGDLMTHNKCAMEFYSILQMMPHI